MFSANRIILFLSVILLLVVANQHTDTFGQPKPGNKATLNLAEASKDPDFLLQGEYVAENKGVQVVAKGKGEFLVVEYKGGLPGAGYDGKNKQTFDENAEGVKDIIKSLKKVERESPTLNLKAPAGAVVLFDGSKETFDKQWQQGAKMSDDNCLRVGCTSVPTFQDYTLHAEFMLSYTPELKGQARSNSGIYHQGRYETQVLDSFGLEGKNNELGGIYEVSDPSLNMAFPPLRWQTYDVDFTAPRFDAQGKKIKNARLTVRLNGVIVQQDVEVPKPTRAAPNGKETVEPGPIYIQDHGNPLHFRNIWVLPKDASREDARPKISSLERYQPGNKELSQASAGLILLGELNCASCHSVGDEWKDFINTKQAPVLTDVGSRINHDYFQSFLENNHSIKPGTTMPEVLHQVPEQERSQAIAALSEFMKSTGIVQHSGMDQFAIKRGEKLFHEVGCAVCHGSSTRSPMTATLNTSVPLGKPELKYSVASLTEFLKNPHDVRPSGRMPALMLKDQDARDVASYLMQNVDPKYVRSSALYEVYFGGFDTLPDFTKLKPDSKGECTAFDLAVASRADQFAVRYIGQFHLAQDSNYTFTIGSDDGSRLLIDGEEIIKVDGIHPHSTASKQLKLKKGVHQVVVEYFENSGEESLSVEVESKNLPKTNLASLMTLPNSKSREEEALQALNPGLVEKGKQLFSSVGCANCHQLKVDNQSLKATIKQQGLLDIATKLKANNQGCMATSPQKNAPWYSLSDTQIASIREALVMISNLKKQSDKPAPRETADLLHQQLLTNNCYACHTRDGIGGPEQSREAYFICTIPEMGEEGRIPPTLNGVGDKLQDGYLQEVWDKGADQRPYMLTSMPKFGANNVKNISEYVIKLDRKTEAAVVSFEDPEFRIKSQGRLLAGEKGLACVKCHTFDKYPATGIQAVALDKMTSRLREDWFRRYLFEPTKYRPGTRMPTGYPEGKATIKDVYDGHPDQQIAAIWTYLKDGNKAAVPAGLIPDPIELIPVDKPIIYRNFISDVSPRGIAVGYPEKLNLTFDADKNLLRLLWHGAFIDASLHWRGRGAGNQTPMGDHLIQFEQQNPFVNDQAGPTAFKFKGYSLNEAGQPVFKYGNEQFQVTDFPVPVKRDKHVDVLRTLTIEAGSNSAKLKFMAGQGKTIEKQADGSYLVDGYLNVNMSGDLESAEIVNKDGKQMLVYQVKTKSKAVIVQYIKW
jgi:mono/diheme cytochrome c family protein